MKIIDTDIKDIKIIKPDVYYDNRGFFMESYTIDYMKSLKINTDFVQDNHSRSSKNIIRGLHFQWNKPLGKLIRITRGSAFVVALDIRKQSKTYGKYVSRNISDETKEQLWAPFGFATGFCACTDIVEVQYKCTATYNPNAESGINPFDKDLNIDWPIRKDDAIISDKDLNAISFKDWNREKKSNVFK
jgi:dTDP-4-dehydrorhamnose 3,5-epimerase